jgi:hypothetical protein
LYALLQGLNFFDKYPMRHGEQAFNRVQLKKRMTHAAIMMLMYVCLGLSTVAALRCVHSRILAPPRHLRLTGFWDFRAQFECFGSHKIVVSMLEWYKSTIHDA